MSEATTMADGDRVGAPRRRRAAQRRRHAPAGCGSSR